MKSALSSLVLLCASSGLFAIDAPTPLFYVPFDGSATAVLGGSPAPLKANALSYGKGVKGQAVFISKDSLLEYQTTGNLKQTSGTICLWFKPAWAPFAQKDFERKQWHGLLSQPYPDGARIGSGALMLWFYGSTFRADVSDAGDSFIRCASSDFSKDAWTHVAFSWDERSGGKLYLNGVFSGGGNTSDFHQPLDLEKPSDFSALRNKFKSFFIGSRSDEAKADGFIDEVKIYDRPLSAAEILAEMAEASPFHLTLSKSLCLAGAPLGLELKLRNVSAAAQAPAFSWTLSGPSGVMKGEVGAAPLKPGDAKAFSLAIPALAKGSYSLTLTPKNAGPELGAAIHCVGGGSDFLKASGDLKLLLVETIDFSEKLPGTRFVSQGSCGKGELAGAKYLEAGTEMNDRFAVKVSLPDAESPYLVEWTYPDDKLRTMEMIAQDAKSSGEDYGLQTGVFCGGEYPLSKKMMTHKSILWARSKDVAFIFMTARKGAPAAISTLRISKIEGGLPDAGIVDATPVDGWNRVVGIHYEDPALAYDFGVKGQLMPDYEETLDRLVAYMKWSGQNFLSYPAIWYQGRIGRTYQPRSHELDYLGLMLAKFSSNGIGLMPSINWHNIRLPEELRIDAKTVSDGSLHSSPVMILNSGKPNPGGWHNTPPNFNILHPLVRSMVESQIDDLLTRYGDNPAFKGVAFDFPKHSITWFGGLEAGYNDYVIDAFEKETGIKLQVDRKTPLRGKLYYEWLMVNAKDKWIAWRCAEIADFYKTIAAKLTAKRSDLRLQLCAYMPSITSTGKDSRFGRPDFTDAILKEGGLDPKLFENFKDIILCQTIYQADWRWRPGGDRDYYFKDGTYSFLSGALHPWINMHDRYWENPVGSKSNGSPLDASWLNEHGWRVSTLNPNANYFLEHYVLPLRYADVQGYMKGGFLIGTCGVEDQIRSFARAFRALPCVRFSDLPASSAEVKFRAFNGKDALWFYAVNTGRTPVKFKAEAEGLFEVAWDGRGSENGVFDLKPCQLRVFKAKPGARLSVSFIGEDGK